MVNKTINEIKKKPYQFFFTKLLLLFLLIYGFDFSIGNLINYFYFKQEHSAESRITYSIDKASEEGLIFGSSRAVHHYRPDIFKDSLKMTFYNVGKAGNYIFYDYAVLKGILKRYSPKTIVLDFTPTELDKFDESYDKLSALLPYYRSHPEIRSVIELKSPYEKYKLLSRIYPFNSTIISLALANTKFHEKVKGEINGYVPLRKNWNEPIKSDSILIKTELDNNKIEYYENFIKDCKNSGIQLFVIVSPWYVKSNHSTYSVIVGEEIARKYNIKFFNYLNDSLFTSNRSLFADVKHLNEKGAEVYSNIVSERMISGN